MKKTYLLITLLCLGNLSCHSMTNYNLYSVTGESLPRENFVQFITTLKADVCRLNPFLMKLECKKNVTLRATGSGFIVKKTNKGSYVVTANHVCHPSAGPGIKVLSSKHEISDLIQRTYKYKVLKFDKKNDMCLVFAKDLNIGTNLAFASHPPREGEKVYNIAAPGGFAKKNLVPIYEGYFIGQEDGKDFYSIYVWPGSSGSMILNNQGRIIGIVCFKRRGLPIALGPKFSILRKFVLTGLN